MMPMINDMDEIIRRGQQMEEPLTSTSAMYPVVPMGEVLQAEAQPAMKKNSDVQAQARKDVSHEPPMNKPATTTEKRASQMQPKSEEASSCQHERRQERLQVAKSAMLRRAQTSKYGRLQAQLSLPSFCRDHGGIRPGEGHDAAAHMQESYALTVPQVLEDGDAVGD